MPNITTNAAARAARKQEGAKLLALVAPAAYAEAVNAMAAAQAVASALKGYKLTKGDGKPSDRFEEVRLAYLAGYCAPRLPGSGNLDRDAALDKARKVIADPKRGDEANKVIASGRQGFKRCLERAGIASPAANGGSSNGKAKGGDKTNAGQGKPDATPSKTVEVTREAAKALPPVKPNRENVVEYIRVGLAQMALCIDKANQAAAKSKGPAVPPQIQSAIEDWRTTAKAWVI